MPWVSKHVTSGYLVVIFKWITATQLYPKVQTNQFTTLSATQIKYTWMWCDYSHSLTFQHTWGTSALPCSLGAQSIQIYRLILNLIPSGVYPARQGNPKLLNTLRFNYTPLLSGMKLWETQGSACLVLSSKKGCVST